MNRIGELFLGQSFGALDSERPPEYMENVDRHFINMAIEGTFPLIHKILTYLPIDEVQKLINASDNLREVSNEQHRALKIMKLNYSFSMAERHSTTTSTPTADNQRERIS